MTIKAKKYVIKLLIFLNICIKNAREELTDLFIFVKIYIKKCPRAGSNHGP